MCGHFHHYRLEGQLSVGAATLGAMDAYKVPLPMGLSVSSSTQSTTFCSNRSRPVTLKGLPKDNLGELLSILISTIHSNIQTCASPEKLLERTTQMVDAENCKLAPHYFSSVPGSFLTLKIFLRGKKPLT
jgi:hypothetical protein